MAKTVAMNTPTMATTVANVTWRSPGNLRTVFMGSSSEIERHVCAKAGLVARDRADMVECAPNLISGITICQECNIDSVKALPLMVTWRGLVARQRERPPPRAPDSKEG